MQSAALVRRILARLWQAEVCEPNPHFQADYRIASIAVLYAARAVPEPLACASYVVLGLHPAKVWPSIVAQRKARLGKHYPQFYDDAGNWKPDPLLDPWSGPSSAQSPRKPVQSVKLVPMPPEEDRAA